jgi:hypothetical protein
MTVTVESGGFRGIPDKQFQTVKQKQKQNYRTEPKHQLWLDKTSL